MKEIRVPIDQIIKKILVQIKYEEMGSWLVTHGIYLFYAHKKGFTIIDKKYIDDHPKLKKILDQTIKDIEKSRNKDLKKSKTKGKVDSNYFG